MRAADVHAVLLAEREPARAPAARGAGRQHERVADQPPDRMVRVAGDRGRHEAVRGPREERHLRARGRAQGIRVAALPVAVDERALAQVADAGAAPAQEAPERTRLGDRVERVRGVVHALRDRRAQVRRAERDDVPDAAGPGVPGLGALVGGAARDEPAHRVADERDLLHRHGPGGDERLEQLVQRAPVLRDVAARVVADVERAAPQVLGEPLAVARAAAEPPRVLGLHQPVEEDDEPPGRGGEGGAQGAGLRRDDAPVRAHGHRLLQVGRLGLERVAVEPVEDRQRLRPAGGRGERPSVAAGAPAEHLAGGEAGERARALQREVDAARDRVVGVADGQRPPGRARRTRAARSRRAGSRCRPRRCPARRRRAGSGPAARPGAEMAPWEEIHPDRARATRAPGPRRPRAARRRRRRAARGGRAGRAGGRGRRVPRPAPRTAR